MRATCLACLLSLSTLSLSSAAEPETHATRPIAQLIAELDDDNFMVREQATRLLLARGPEVLEPLKEALAETSSLEVKARARHILQALSRHDGGGQTVNGLKLRLHTDADKVRPGSKVILTTTLCNVTEEDINVQVGFSTCGNYFQCGGSLRVLDAAGRESKQRWLVEQCATGAGPIFATVPARGTLEFTTPVSLLVEDDALLYASKLVAVEAPRAGRHRLCMELSAAAGQARLPVAVVPANPRAAYWTGNLRSNVVELEVVH